jgi:hypothetical protein
MFATGRSYNFLKGISSVRSNLQVLLKAAHRKSHGAQAAPYEEAETEDSSIHCHFNSATGNMPVLKSEKCLEMEALLVYATIGFAED